MPREVHASTGEHLVFGRLRYPLLGPTIGKGGKPKIMIIHRAAALGVGRSYRLFLFLMGGGPGGATRCVDPAPAPLVQFPGTGTIFKI